MCDESSLGLGFIHAVLWLQAFGAPGMSAHAVVTVVVVVAIVVVVVAIVRLPVGSNVSSQQCPARG